VDAVVEQELEVPVLVPDEDELVLTDVAQHVVTRAGDFGLMADEHPAAVEDPLELGLVNVLVVEYPRTEQSLLEVLDYLRHVQGKRLCHPVLLALIGPGVLAMTGFCRGI
jgi:hypothetical protein